MAISASSISETQTGPLGSDDNGAYFQPSRGGLDRTTAAGINLGTCTVSGNIITANSASRTAVTADLGNYVCFAGVTQRFEVTSVAGGEYVLDSAPGVTGVNAILGGPGATYNFIVSLNTASNVWHYLKCLYTLVSGVTRWTQANSLLESTIPGVVTDDYVYIMPGGNCIPGRYRVLSVSGGVVLLSKALNLTSGTVITNPCYIVKPAKVTQRYAVAGDSNACMGIAGAGSRLIGYNLSRSILEFAASPVLFKNVAASWSVAITDVSFTNTMMEALLVDREWGVSSTANLVYGPGARYCHLKNAGSFLHLGVGVCNLYEAEQLVSTTRSGDCGAHHKSNCVALFCNTPFADNYESSGCIAVDCTVGFRTTSFATHGCTAYNCVTGFEFNGRAPSRDLLAINCGTGYKFNSVGNWRGDERLAHFGNTVVSTGTPGSATNPLIALSAMPLMDPPSGDFRPKPGSDGDALKYYESIPQYLLATPPQHDRWIGALPRTESTGGGAPMIGSRIGKAA